MRFVFAAGAVLVAALAAMGGLWKLFGGPSCVVDVPLALIVLWRVTKAVESRPIDPY